MCPSTAELGGAFINQLNAQSGSGIDAATADRFIAYAQDIIDRGA